MAIGHQNGPSYSLGIAISSLVKVKLLPSTEIDLNALVTANDQESIEALAAGEVTFALAAIDNARPPDSPEIRALATLGRADDLALTLLVRRNADDDLVRTILDTLLDHVDFLSMIDQRAAGLTADAALLGLAVPLHDGAKRFYMEQWSASAGPSPAATPSAASPPARIATAAPAPVEPAPAAPSQGDGRAHEPADARNFVLYFDFDDATLNTATRSTLSNAASFAQSLDNPAIIIAAYTDAAGDADYNYLLAERRADAVMQGLDALGVRYSRIETSLFGERSPWAVTLDGVGEASNRRVELFIEEPVDAVQLLPVSEAPTTPASERETDPRPGEDEVTTIPAAAPPLSKDGPKKRILPLNSTM
jgi:outer membrane protein OmpA-like peptidoglycan-associated protein